MSLTLLQAQTQLARYFGANNTSTDRLNQVTERLAKNGNWKGTKQTTVFAVHPDAEGRAFITLPWTLNTVLGGVYFRNDTNDPAALRCGLPVVVRDAWFSFLQTGPGFHEQARFNYGNGVIPEVDRFTTFRNFFTAKKLRLKFAATEANGLVFNIRGRLNGQDIYTGAGASTIEGENLTTVGATTLTTTSDFDEIPYAISKPITYGVVSLYTWDGVEEVLIARYAPQETVPQWTRYRVPACTDWTEADPGQFLAVCKRQWQPISNANDLVVPGTIGALKFGLQALLKEDSQDYARADEVWEKAFKMLADEVMDDDGAGATSPVQVADSFLMNCGTMGGGYYNGYGYGY